jgi:hypothetical protein
MDAPRHRVERSKLPFMQWPVEWLWIAVIVAVTMLFLLGLVVGTEPSGREASGMPSPVTAEPAREC